MNPYRIPREAIGAGRAAGQAAAEGKVGRLAAWAAAEAGIHAAAPFFQMQYRARAESFRRQARGWRDLAESYRAELMAALDTLANIQKELETKQAELSARAEDQRNEGDTEEWRALLANAQGVKIARDILEKGEA